MKTPTAIKKLRGTLRADRVVAHEAPTLPLPRRVVAPAWLSPAAVAIWRDLVPQLRAMRVLGAQDLPLVAMLAHQRSVYEEAARALATKVGLTFVVTDGDGAPKGIQPWPEIKIAAGALVEIRRLSEHFGLSPASRGRVSSSTSSAAPDEFSEFDRPELLRHRPRAVGAAS